MPVSPPSTESSRAPTLHLTAQQRHAFHRDGIVYPISVLAAHEFARYRAACDQLEQSLGGQPRTVEVRQMHLHFSWAYELATHARILDAVQDVLGPNLLIWATELFAKHPHAEAISIRWHRDQTYMGFPRGTSVTAWVALGPVTRANGCMCAVPRWADAHGGDGGDHEAFRHSSGEHTGARRGWQPPEDAFCAVELSAGQMSLHDVDVLHGSGPNRDNEKRVGFVIRYVTPEARPRHNPSVAVLARGRYADEHFQLAGPPPERTLAQAVEALRRSAALHFQAVLNNSKESV